MCKAIAFVVLFSETRSEFQIQLHRRWIVEQCLAKVAIKKEITYTIKFMYVAPNTLKYKF